jgi:hypothetical protein
MDKTEEKRIAAKRHKKLKTGPEVPAPFLFFAVQQSKIMQFQQDLNHKERKEHRDKNLWRFFFAIFAFFAVNSSLVAACRAGPFAPFRGHSVTSVPSISRSNRFCLLHFSC